MFSRSPLVYKNYHKALLYFRQWVLLSSTLILIGCSIGTLIPTQKKVIGVISVSEPTIAKVGIQVLENGGNAADAMATMLMSGAVVLPSRMGLGAGGICQILDPAERRVKTLNFLSRPMSFDRKIAVPALLRGVYALQNKYGRKQWSEILDAPIKQAQNGVAVSDLLSKDILTSSRLNSSWKKKKKGDSLVQPELANTLKTFSQEGVGSLYSGQMASSIVNQSDQIIQEDLRSFKASFMDSIDVSRSSGKTFFPNPSVLSSDAYMIWRNAQSNKAERQQQAIENMKKLENNVVSIDERVQGMGVIASDDSGLVISCTVSMGQTFGTGQLVKEGFYLGNALPRGDNLSVYANFMEVNPDTTDVLFVLSGVGNYALVDALNDFSYRLDKKYLLENEDDLSDDRQENNALFASMYCEKGYPNHPQTCEQGKKIYLVQKKE